MPLWLALSFLAAAGAALVQRGWSWCCVPRLALLCLPPEPRGWPRAPAAPRGPAVRGEAQDNARGGCGHLLSASLVGLVAALHVLFQTELLHFASFITCNKYSGAGKRTCHVWPAPPFILFGWLFVKLTLRSAGLVPEMPAPLKHPGTALQPQQGEPIKPQDYNHSSVYYLFPQQQ